MSSRRKPYRRHLAPSPPQQRCQQPGAGPGTRKPGTRLPIAEHYTPPAPRELPELRARLARWLASDAPRFYLTMTLAGRHVLPPGPDIAVGAARYAAQEQHRVTDGDLYWVSAPMTGLARHAAPQLPTRNLYPHDVPSRSGFMVFEAPLATYINDEGREVQIVAVSWGPWDNRPHRAGQDGLHLSFYSHPAPVFPRAAFTSGTADPAALAFLAPLLGTVPPLLPDNEAGWPFGGLSDDERIPEGTTASWALTIRAAWRLMRQPLAQETTERADRAARRRLARAGQPAPGIRVIHIRRKEHARTPASDLGLSREHDHQWWVRGHWRTYWCGPGRHRPEDRWIDPYLAGPDDKPVRGTDRVKVWDR